MVIWKDRRVSIEIASLSEIARPTSRLCTSLKSCYLRFRYEDFVKRLDKAERALDRREERLRQVYDSVENNLELIGAIGIEDRLQVEILLNFFCRAIDTSNYLVPCGLFQPSLSLLIEQSPRNKSSLVLQNYFQNPQITIYNDDQNGKYKEKSLKPQAWWLGCRDQIVRLK